MTISRPIKSLPNVAITVHREIDPFFQWDGDGPDPADDGFDAYDVIVTATTIVAGEFVKGKAYCGGTYYRMDEPIGDVHGYLPQMMQEALEDLSGYVIGFRQQEILDALKELKG